MRPFDKKAAAEGWPVVLHGDPGDPRISLVYIGDRPSTGQPILESPRGCIVSYQQSELRMAPRKVVKWAVGSRNTAGVISLGAPYDTEVQAQEHIYTWRGDVTHKYLFVARVEWEE